MSQNDFNIANQGFPSFRSDLNSALQALASTSSGATAPATPYANQLWYDTANDLLKIRNGANSAWINLFGVSTDGFVIEDKIVHAGDTNTSIRFPAADTVTVETNGAERMRVASSGNVGIGTTSASSRLTVAGGGTTLGGTTAFNAEIVEEISSAKRGLLLGHDTSSQIGIIGANSGGAASNLAFWTFSGSAWGERMRINSAGNVGIGTSSPSSALDVNGTIRSNSWAGTVSSTGYGAIIQRGSNANGEFTRFADGTQVCTYAENITPVANTFTSYTWTYPVAFSETPNIQATANSVAVAIKNVQFGSPSASSVLIGIVRENTTSTSVAALATGRWF